MNRQLLHSSLLVASFGMQRKTSKRTSTSIHAFQLHDPGESIWGNTTNTTVLGSISRGVLGSVTTLGFISGSEPLPLTYLSTCPLSATRLENTSSPSGGVSTYSMRGTMLPAPSDDDDDYDVTCTSMVEFWSPPMFTASIDTPEGADSEPNMA